MSSNYLNISQYELLLAPIISNPYNHLLFSQITQIKHHTPETYIYYV